MLAIQCRQIKKNYKTQAGEVMALREIDLEVALGQLVIIVGPSGSGKTTLLSIIAGILTPDEGECLVFDQNIHHMENGEKTAFRGKNIGFVFQSFNLVPMLSCRENVAVPLILNGANSREAEEKAYKLLEHLEIQDKADLSPRELSGGQQQRVAIARSIIHEPKLIVCDEPTAYLDHETGQKVMHILKDEALNKERAIVVVTHDPRIFDFADKIAKIEDGRISNNK